MENARSKNTLDSIKKEGRLLEDLDKIQEGGQRPRDFLDMRWNL